jgi:predicted dehydrogenase/nucleoside-diphosphate-sugar epimerase
LKALVTGGTGYLGKHLVAELLADHWAVRVLARHPARARRLPQGVTFIYGDLENEVALTAALCDIDVVFHLAAAIGGPWETHRRVTVDGTRRMLALASEAGVKRFVLVSSIAVYDKRGLEAGAIVDESTPLLPAAQSSGAYARGKVEAERLAREFSERARHARADAPSTKAPAEQSPTAEISSRAAADTGQSSPLEVVIVRPGLVYGPGRLSFNHLGELVGATRVAYGRPTLLLPLVEARSCANALVELAKSRNAAGHTYHVVDAHVTTRRDYWQALDGLTGYRQPVVYLPTWPVAVVCGALGALGRLAKIRRAADWSAGKVRTRSVELRYDTAALVRDTDWRPQPALEPGLARALGLNGQAAKPDGRPKRGPGAGARSSRAIKRVGLIGAGAMARAHVDALKRVPGARITGILDTRVEAAEALAREAGGVAAFGDVERFFAEAGPELVHIVTPPGQHAAAARSALAHGAHVLIEKPATVTLEDCDSLLSAADQRALTIGVEETVAFDPLVRQARASLANGVLGELVHVDVHMGYDLHRGGRLERILGTPECWERALPGGPLEDLLPHPLSIVRALAGPLTLEHWRSKCTGRLPADFPDELRLCLAGEGVTAAVSLSLSSRPDDLLVIVHGTRATARIDLQNVLFDCLTPLPGPRAVARGLRVLRSGLRVLGQTVGNGFAMAAGLAPTPVSSRHLILAHHAALARGRPPPAPLAAARHDIAIARTVWPVVRAGGMAEAARTRVRAV